MPGCPVRVSREPEEPPVSRRRAGRGGGGDRGRAGEVLGDARSPVRGRGRTHAPDADRGGARRRPRRGGVRAGSGQRRVPGRRARAGGDRLAQPRPVDADVLHQWRPLRGRASTRSPTPSRAPARRAQPLHAVFREARVRSTDRPRRQIITIGPHEIVSDLPADEDGDDAGPGPHDLLLAALGACTAMTVQWSAQKHRLALERVEVRLTPVADRDRTSVPAFDPDQRRSRASGIARSCSTRRRTARSRARSSPKSPSRRACRWIPRRPAARVPDVGARRRQSSASAR